ncbi:MAG TPA: phage terminase large subunit [Pirellulaceae bacterium]|nr:phage terminase large subunit [Pirellulaceae bacterium]
MSAIEEAAAGRLDGLVVSMPPQHGKSELCSKYLPAWYLGTFPDRRVILTSYEADFAGTWGRKARDLLDQWGHLFGVAVSKRSSSVHRWDLEGREGGMTTAGVGGPITGRGAHLLVIDDPIKNDEEARSATHRQKQWDWWQSTASTRLRPGALMVVIQTRWHRDDLTGRLIREAQTNGQRWRVVKLPALAEAHDPLGRSPGEALWPEVYTAEKLQQIKNSRTNYYWRSLYQQDPLAEGGLEWPESFFGPKIWFEERPQYRQCRVVALDPSKGRDGKLGDYSAFILLDVGDDGTLYVDADLAVRNTRVIAETALEIQRRFQPDAFGIETNQFQELLADDILRLAEERRMDMPLFTINNQVPKVVRIRRLTPYLAQGRMRFQAGSPSARLLVEQLRDFPCGDHDDGPDALEMAVRLASDMLRPPPEDRITYVYT